MVGCCEGKLGVGLGVGLLGEGRYYLVSAGGVSLYARAYLGSWWFCVVWGKGRRITLSVRRVDSLVGLQCGRVVLRLGPQ